MSGGLNETSGYSSSVNEGVNKLASGTYCVIGCGPHHRANGMNGWRAGSLFEVD